MECSSGAVRATCVIQLYKMLEHFGQCYEVQKDLKILKRRTTMSGALDGHSCCKNISLGHQVNLWTNREGSNEMIGCQNSPNLQSNNTIQFALGKNVIFK